MSNNIIIKLNTQQEEKIDIFSLLLTGFLTISLLYGARYIMSKDPQLKEIGLMAVALGTLSFTAISFTALLISIGIIKIQKLSLGYDKNISIKSIIAKDDTLGKDYARWFIIGILVQIIVSYVYGSYLGFHFSIGNEWSLNTLLLTLNAGIAEELFFSLFLGGMLLSFGTKKLQVLISGIVITISFTILHNVVYETEQRAILFIAILRILYFLIYYKTRRVSIPMVLYCLNNFLFVQTMLFI